MKLIVTLSGKEIKIEIRNTQSVPDILKTCQALGHTPLRWEIIES